MFAEMRARLAVDPTAAPHGQNSTYSNWGCRCDECRAAHGEKMIEDRASRIARVEAGSPDVPHGTRSGYSNWGCRCDECRGTA
jgi:hypothetical protein